MNGIRRTKRIVALLVAGTLVGILGPSVSAYGTDKRGPCVSGHEFNNFPRTYKGAVEKYLKQEGVRDQQYDEFAEEFGFETGKVVLFMYRSCERPRSKRGVEIYYKKRKGKAWPVVASSYAGNPDDRSSS